MLDEARTLVRLPVEPVPPSMRAAAVEAAIADGLADQSGSPGIAVTSRAPRAIRRARPQRALVGAAAAVAVLVAAVGVSLGLAHTSTPTASSASRAAVHEPQRASASGSKATSTSGGIPALGSIASPGALSRRLAPLLAAGDKVAQGNPSSNLSSSGAAVGPTNAPAAGTYSAASTVPPSFGTCITAAQRATDPSDTVVLVATATYRKTPALVVVVQAVGTSSTSAPRIAVVVARSGCRVLTRTTL
jgi:hypothetical protein